MFLMSFILWGSLAATIPIVVHLLHRRKIVPIQWGAMQFLLETSLKKSRHLKINHWLLMLLRMTILFLLAILLARPIVQGV
ncbi:MAG: BatA domain-containing protein, partial [Phycisphaerales bacterium]|nr:BatA domain-containing protein [Phycisphaerales bacterium]